MSMVVNEPGEEIHCIVEAVCLEIPIPFPLSFRLLWKFLWDLESYNTMTH